MRKFSIIFIIFILLSCSEKQNQIKPLKFHESTNEILQIIIDSNAVKLYGKAMDLYNVQQYDSATVYLKRSLEFEKSPITYNGLGTIQLTYTNYQRATEYYNMGKKVDCTYWPNYINEARVHILLEKFTDGKLVLENVIEKSDSEFWISYANFYLAILYYNNNRQCVKALNYLSKSNELKQDSDLKDIYLKTEKTIKKYCR